VDLIVDLIDQLVDARVKHARGLEHDVEIAKIKERLRLVLVENLGRK
jgi:hypothetical protein